MVLTISMLCYSALAFQMAGYSSGDYLTDALQFDFKVAPLSMYHRRDEFQDRKISWE